MLKFVSSTFSKNFPGCINSWFVNDYQVTPTVNQLDFAARKFHVLAFWVDTRGFSLCTPIQFMPDHEICKI